MQATGSSSSAWGGRRAAAGHPSPYTLQAFAIGNEDCRVKGYAPNFVTIAKAVRAAYPKLPLILGCEEQDQMKDMVRRATTHDAKALRPCRPRASLLGTLKESGAVKSRLIRRL